MKKKIKVHEEQGGRDDGDDAVRLPALLAKACDLYTVVLKTGA
jgi:hypothetical protein